MQKNLDPDWAWKNLKHWWNSYHYDCKGNKTKWVPKMKKIWFTELGFASIDKTTNQPNVFYNPDCRDGGSPIGSIERVNFDIQKKSLLASIKWIESQ